MHENRETSRTSRPYPGRDQSEKAKCRNADRRVPEESDCTVVPMNPANNEEQSSAEQGEGRVQAKENIVQSNTDPTQSGKQVSQGLRGVRQVARERKQERFTALLHHVSVGLLRASFYALPCPSHSRAILPRT
jgi:IMP dehydrogenase/GMP reductase